MQPTELDVPEVTRDELIRGLRAHRITLVDVLAASLLHELGYTQAKRCSPV